MKFYAEMILYATILSKVMAGRDGTSTMELSYKIIVYRYGGGQIFL
jgi:hypothetical protein